MSLYDDLEPSKQNTEQVAGWSSSIKLFQTQLQAKKAAQQIPKRDQRRLPTVLTPVIDLKSKKDEGDHTPPTMFIPKERKQSAYSAVKEFDWKIVNEYDPAWPNDYEKVAKDLKDLREKEREKEEQEEIDRRKRARDERTGRRDRDQKSGMPGRRDSEEEEEEERPQRTGGVAIAPPPSLQETKTESPVSSPIIPANISFAGSAVAAKIMAKYGFKEGQGLGKKEQGMSLALQVEKTSKRGGRIIHEKDIMPPPAPSSPPLNRPDSPKPVNITEVLRNPSKVVLLKNMVGPGEVDEELEPEVKEECCKYGEVTRVIIHEVDDAPAEEAIRIFIEFKRIESAIKAVVDLSARFFGGRQVKAGFYDWERFNELELMDGF